MRYKRTRIKSIRITNYRQYKEMYFDFPFDRKNDLHIIIAKNGVGKSNFLNAITWCLYGKENHLQEKSKALPIVNLETLSNAREKEQISVSVEIVVEVNGTDKTFCRTQTFAKSNSGVVNIDSGKLSVSEQLYDDFVGYPRLQTIDGENAKIIVNRVFPEAINGYFFFDNEQMNNYFTENEGGAIQSAINTISKIDVVQSLLNHITNDKADLRRKTKNNANIKVYQDREELCKQKLDNRLIEYNDIKVELTAGQNRLTMLNEAIKGAEETKAIEIKREACSEKIERLKYDESKLMVKIDHFISNYTVLLNMYPLLKKTDDKIAELGKRRQLPPEISMEILKKSLNENTCGVCGNVLSTEQAQRILGLLETYNVASPSYELLLRVHSSIKDLMARAKNYKIEKENLIKEQQKLDEAIDKESEKLSEYTNQLKAVANKDEIIRKIEQRDEIQSKVNDLQRQIIRKEFEVSSATSELEKAEKETNNALAKDEANKKLLQKITFLDSIIKVLSEVEKEMIDETRNSISEETYSNFVASIWKKNTYKEVKIDKNYNVDLIHNKGYSAIGSTSAAERSLLALAFTNAIHKVSGFESPLVIDSPVGRVSDDNRRKFSESLAEVSKYKQVIMLFTPDEYSSDVSVVFDLIAKKATAEMNENEDNTMIRRL